MIVLKLRLYEGFNQSQSSSNCLMMDRLMVHACAQVITASELHRIKNAIGLTSDATRTN